MGIVIYEQEIRQWYERFVQQFVRDDVEFMKNINLKYDHTERVVIESRGIATSIGASPKEMTIALLVAMLHDVGRYPQLLEFNTFDDRKSINHAKLGATVIYEEEVLRKLDEKDRDIIHMVVGHHNTLSISSKHTVAVKKHLKILRDADKLDIWRMLAAHYTETEREQNRTIDLNLPKGDTVHPGIIESLTNRENVKSEHVSNRTELKLLQLSWVYDLNFPWSFQVIQKRQFLNDIASTLPQLPELEPIIQQILAYVAQEAQDAKESGLRGR